MHIEMGMGRMCQMFPKTVTKSVCTVNTEHATEILWQRCVGYAVKYMKYET